MASVVLVADAAASEDENELLRPPLRYVAQRKEEFTDGRWPTKVFDERHQGGKIAKQVPARVTRQSVQGIFPQFQVPG